MNDGNVNANGMHSSRLLFHHHDLPAGKQQTETVRLACVRRESAGTLAGDCVFGGLRLCQWPGTFRPMKRRLIPPWEQSVERGKARGPVEGLR